MPAEMTEKQKSRKKIVEEKSVEDDIIDDDQQLSDEDDTDVIEGIRIPRATKPTLSFDPTGPRLIITRITNNFFKSYAGEQILAPFHKCFNAIIGPNGSGKSNVIDSMLFVFGYRATKIRSKKVSVLLHNSDRYRNVQSCSVAVHFALIIDKSGDEYDVVPGSEFVVSRVANKDNSSHYTLNGKRVQFKEVGKILKTHGIDLDHNRFLILQGEVEQISMMKCKAESEHETGMLEYLEDIIGTNRYKKPLTQVTERVEYLTALKTEKLNRMQLVDNELKELQAPMEEAVKFLKVENKVVTSKNFLYQKNIYNIETKLERLEEQKKEVVAEQKAFEDNLQQIHEKKIEKETLLKEKSATYEHLKTRKESLTDAFNKANNKDIQLQETMTQTNTTRKKTKELIVAEKAKLEKLKKVPEESKGGIEECERKIEELSAKKEKYEEEKTKILSSLRTETKTLQEKKDVIQNQLVGLKEAVDETKSQYKLAESELNIYVSNEEGEKEKLKNLLEEYENVDSTIAERIKQVNTLKKKIPATEKSLNSAMEELNVVKLQESQLISEIRGNRTQLEEKKSSMQATKSKGAVLDGLMNQKRDGNCPGLYGRLGDLGAIDQKYDVAISTACGPLDNIVVDTVSTAEWCIQFLKKYNLGRATFIALDKQEHLRPYATSRISTPENVHRLYDLIKVPDEDVRTAFYYALRDTLVAGDLEQATRIAYGAQRFRVVTLNGELIETTGTMSGGGGRVSKGRMGQSVRVSNVDPKELQNLEEDIQQMEQQVRDLRQKQASLESQINTLQPELRQMKVDYEKFSMELKGLQQQKPVLEKQLKEQEQKSKVTKADPAKVKQLTKIVEQKKELYDEASERAGVLQRQVDDLTAQIKEKTSGKMKTIDKNINEATKTVDKCKAEITRLKVAVTTSQRNTVKSEEKIKTMEQDITDMENRLRQMKAERTEIEEDAKKLLDYVKEVTEQLAEEEEKYGDVKKEVAHLLKQENKIKSDKVDVDQKVKTFDSKASDYKGAIHQLEKKISHLKPQDIPNETPVELKKYTHEELEDQDTATVEKELEAAETHLKVAKPNLNAIEEYRKKQTVYIERCKDVEEVNNKRVEMKQLLESLKSRRKDEFITGYNIIKLKLKEMYQMITLGGDADFEMVDTYDPFSEGIQFNVRPPKKSWKKISNLSGGEKTLSSLALVFALHYYKPSPLYVMDEIDAALDFKNVSIVGNYIKQRTKNAQFIIISLRSNMFELCDNLIGIYKTYDCTKSITIDPRVYDEQTKQNEKRMSHGSTNEETRRTIEATSGTGDSGDKNPEKNVSSEVVDNEPSNQMEVDSVVQSTNNTRDSSGLSSSMSENSLQESQVP
ncbi:unnamed protein product [Diabrotica balteata]|uniref:Structural maintenance of chromosomes protein n=1 Tax=Diabrotica balteata TaxID=107213 RepID=A0A9N9T1Y0_DIABA|nr:unnamed protein product [Diabrotica balteata]